MGPDEYGGHAQRAHELDALGALCQLSAHSGLAPSASEMASNILLRWVHVFCVRVVLWWW